MTIEAKVIADSVSPDMIRLTTMQCRYPKFVHGEFMTHRVFSRNASSSRAIPVERLIDDVMRDPAMPTYWGVNRPGMQAVEEMDDTDKEFAIDRWLLARNLAVVTAKKLHARRVHKQIVNRVIEPWCHINVVVTATEWANFFALRRHRDAQPEMRALADAMWDAREASTPKPLKPGKWHLPYVTDDDRQQAYWDSRYLGRDNSECFDEDEALQTCIRLSVARCARVSYLTHEGKPPNVEDDLKLYERLVGGVPLHASPAEHQATPDHPYRGGEAGSRWHSPHLHGNLVGWIQYRKTLPNESASDR